ncbi:DUF6585 family protein [Streptomyces sp. NPDC017993]|uniref:DUF6585 family protein n=1 Tax=Streptomyces sp. NPDC017993 TaxID=3365027 RepID=UPI00379A454D
MTGPATGPTPHSRGEELLLARISAAAGRAHLGKRRATYAGAAHPTRPPAGPARVIRCLLAFARYGRPSATKARAEARLDLYEHGMTVAVRRRIHLIRYDTTSVFHKGARLPHDSAGAGPTRLYTLTDIEGKQVELYGELGDSDAGEWVPEVQRAVTRAQLPRALAALDAGERLTFGDVWLTREEVGSGEVSARWPQVRQMETTYGTIRLNIDGNWHTLAPTAATIPNLFVFHTLVEHFRTGGVHG